MTSERLDKMRMELRRGVLVLAVLSALGEEHYGYSLRRQFLDAGLEIDEGTLYPLLRRLEDQGLLTSTWREGDGRRRRCYRISDTGESLLEQLRGEWLHINEAITTLLETSS